MLAAPDTSHVYTDFQGLAQLRAKSRTNSREALQQVGRQFEAYFLQQLLHSSRQASVGGGLLDSGQTRFFQGLFDQQVALTLSQARGIGLAELLVQQLEGYHAGAERPTEARKEPPANADTPAPQLPEWRRYPGVSPSARSHRAIGEPAARGTGAIDAVAGQRQDAGFGSPDEFVNGLMPYAMRVAGEMGVDPRLLLAQAALETGWGRSVIGDAAGRSSYNLFGIKANAAWNGPVMTVDTFEFEDGVMVRQKAAFRAYESYEASFRDYLEFLRANPRYTEAMQRTGDPEAFARELQRAGYATDPRYADKILGIYAMDVLGVRES